MGCSSYAVFWALFYIICCHSSVYLRSKREQGTSTHYAYTPTQTATPALAACCSVGWSFNTTYVTTEYVVLHHDLLIKFKLWTRSSRFSKHTVHKVVDAMQDSLENVWVYTNSFIQTNKQKQTTAPYSCKVRMCMNVKQQQKLLEKEVHPVDFPWITLKFNKHHLLQPQRNISRISILHHLTQTRKGSKTNQVKTSNGFSTPALSLKLSDLIPQPHKVSWAITGSYYFTPMQCKVASASSRLFGTPSSFSLQPLSPLMATLGAFPSWSQKLRNWDSELNFFGWLTRLCL